MMNKSVFLKTISCLFTATIVVGALSYSSERFEPKKVDFSAFKNASQNIQHITQKTEIKKDVVTTDVTGGIVKTIESEVKRKIHRTRYSLAPKAPKTIKTVEVQEVALASTFEINNKELINLYGFEIETLSFDSFSNVAIAAVEEASINDEVQVAQASTTTNVVEEIIPAKETIAEAQPEMQTETPGDLEAATIATTENKVNDEMVVFDYSENSAAPEVVNTPKSKRMFDAPISNSVKEVIERELHKSSSTKRVNTQVAMNTSKKLLPSTDDANLEKIMEDEDNLVFDYSKQSLAGVFKKEATDKAIAGFSALTTPNMGTQVEFKITAQEINMSTQKVRQSFGFEFVPDYDRADRMDDQTSGEIKVGYSVASTVNTQTGVVQAQGMIPTRVELNLLDSGMNVPLINEESIQKFLVKKGMDITGNLLMTAIDENIQDVEIDSTYQAKIFFTDKFKVVTNQDNASYVMFLGVNNGNVLIRYLLDNKESAQKIVYVGEGEMYFENPDFVGTQRELYTFTTRSLLGRKVKELNIDGGDISFLGTKNTSKKKTLNSYEIKVPELVDNSRKYLEFKHLGNSLIVGTSDTKEIEIPSNDFIGKVLQVNQLSELGERCMVQVNLTKELRDFKVGGKNRSGEMFSEMAFLDNDGNFSRDNSELAEKVFITGDLEGVFNVKLDYTDGTTDFLKTFCVEGSYIVEQL